MVGQRHAVVRPGAAFEAPVGEIMLAGNDVKQLVAIPKPSTTAASGAAGERDGSSQAAPQTAAVVPLRFTAEETILLRGLGAGGTVKAVARQLRLTREALYRLLGDLRRKTGVVNDVALAVWVVRHMRTHDQRSRGR